MRARGRESGRQGQRGREYILCSGQNDTKPTERTVHYTGLECYLSMYLVCVHDYTVFYPVDG